MEDTLKRLLAAETQAGKIAAQAEKEAEALVQSTLRDIQHQETLFQERIPELRASYLDKSAQRAEQSIKEIERRYAEHLAQLRARAEENEESALDAAFNYLMQPPRRSGQ